MVPYFGHTETQHVRNAPENAGAPLEYAEMARQKYRKRHSAEDKYSFDPPLRGEASVVDAFREKDTCKKDGRPNSELFEQHGSSPQSMTGLDVSIDLISALSKKHF